MLEALTVLFDVSERIDLFIVKYVFKSEFVRMTFADRVE
jgi:hypothetical protein